MISAEHIGFCGTGPIAGTSMPHERISILEIVDKQYKQAGQGKLRQVKLAFPPATVISSACGSIFSMVDRDDDEQRRIARQAWIIKSTILQTMLQFDDPRLGLASMAEVMSLAAAAVPTIASPVDSLLRMMRELVATPRNPKREWFLAQLKSADKPDLQIAILAAY